MSVDPAIIAAWTAAWAISRGKPAPVPVHGGFYVRDGRPRQTARYVFPQLCETVLGELTGAIDEPWIYLKFCAPRAAVAPLLPPGWSIAEPAYLMAAGGAVLGRPATPSPGYDWAMSEQDGVVALAMSSAAGEPAARGRLVLHGRLAIFDQIETEEAHARRGLGSAVMRRLGEEAVKRGAKRGILVATPAGRALYLSLGWRTLSDFTSVFIDGGSGAS